jgi:large subunit ribosomal protein L9
MKVILKENIDTLGHIGDIVKVAPGYARNYLLPKGFAVEATEKNAKALEHVKRQMAYKKDKVTAAAKLQIAALESLTVAIVHQAEHLAG